MNQGDGDPKPTETTATTSQPRRRRRRPDDPDAGARAGRRRCARPRGHAVRGRACGCGSTPVCRPSASTATPSASERRPGRDGRVASSPAETCPRERVAHPAPRTRRRSRSASRPEPRRIAGTRDRGRARHAQLAALRVPLRHAGTLGLRGDADECDVLGRRTRASRSAASVRACSRPQIIPGNRRSEHHRHVPRRSAEATCRPSSRTPCRAS